MSAPDTSALIENRSLEEKFDPEMRFRPLLPGTAWLVAGLLLTLSMFHYYTAGFGLLREATHRGIHMAFVLGLIFLVFSAFKSDQDRVVPSSLWRPGGISLVDWGLAVAVAIASLYVPWIFNELAFRVGNPSTTDVVMGTILIVLLLEATRRSVGWPLPVIGIGMMLYAYFGPSMPGILQHPGATWSNIVNHLYLTSQGIYGIALGVVATYVFHYVLFGVLATRVGLGKLFIDLATCVAGRYAGGPAKVSIFGSALFGMISGSSIANTVTVGSLTIPAMIRVGYKRHFAAAVESAASTGGQITPPIMGAAAFLMVEFLNVSYQTVILAALVPACMHFFGVFMQVHLEAKRAGLRGLPAEELPVAAKVIREGWQTIMPLAVLLMVLFSGFTPYLAAFWGITACIVVGVSRIPAVTLGFLAAVAIGIAAGLLTQIVFVLPLLLLVVALLIYAYVTSDAGKAKVIDLIDAFVVGAKYAIGVGAAAATVGIIVGIVTLTGVGFKISFIVTSFAAQMAQTMSEILPVWFMDVKSMTLFFTLLMTAVVCILLGCGVPTTANYIIMVTVAAPALGLLGVTPIVAHFFVFYYGVLADITPPVALAAYAGASMAGADPFKTGNTAFRLGLGKALVPFVFVYGPAMLLVTPDFTWASFFLVTAGAIAGILCLSAAFAGYALTEMRAWERWLIGIAALPIIAPDLRTTLVGLAIATPVLASQLLKARAQTASAPA
ncbi:TRAP transporter permease [Microvirga sp. M2]|uniref:TRAP transporter permease n=1 Tax=Microvirga sp. M2 TaxID=3073270 RepID=UPI0039C47361